MRKIVIAMDSFKGCLSSLEAGRAVEQGIKDVFPAAQTLVLGVSDGDGFVATFEHFTVKQLPDQRRLEWLEKH